MDEFSIYLAEGLNEFSNNKRPLPIEPIGQFLERAELEFLAGRPTSNSRVTKTAIANEWDEPIADGKLLAKRAPDKSADPRVARIEKRANGWVIEYAADGSMIRGHVEEAA